LQSQFVKCFNQYDIRGLVGKELNNETSYRLGRLFALKSVVIAKDARLSSSKLLESFKQGLFDSGSFVIELEGVSSSPLLYFASLYLNTAGAVMITGSHNGLEYNGFKFMKYGKPFYGEELRQILTNQIIDRAGTHIVKNCLEDYTNALLKNINITKEFKIAWECNNSGVALILKQLNLLGEQFLLNPEVDGKFAYLPPDPMVESNLDQIKALVINKSCDFGFAFDGDGDRLRFIKSDGESLTSDQLIYLLALSLKSDQKNKIILDVKSSQILIEALKHEGFEVILASGGHSIMKDKIISENAILAGEASGHFIINDGKYYPLDDAL
jgi:phosphomannomutase